MKAVGIIAEYNPFHNGHLYQIEKVKEMFPEHIIIVILGGHFLERGEPSIIDKWKRTEIALKNNVDLVVELPYPFASQSADYFAHGAISLLSHLQVEYLVFGSESNDIDSINLLVDTELNHPEYHTLASIYLKEGYNYPTALSKALFDLTEKKVTLPNDLLGISYVKEIKQQNSGIKPSCMQRTNSYHNKTLEENISSATSIRASLKNKESVKNVIPVETQKYVKEELHFLEDYFPLLKYKIMTSKDLSVYHTVDEGIEHRIKKYIASSTSYEDLINKIKTKRYTYNKIQRMLTHILCDFTKEEASRMREIEYIRVLGFSISGRNYLNQIKKEVTIPIISNFSKLKNEMLQLEYRITSVYASTLEEEKKIKLIEEEYKHHPFIN